MRRLRSQVSFVELRGLAAPAPSIVAPVRRSYAGGISVGNVLLLWFPFRRVHGGDDVRRDAPSSGLHRRRTVSATHQENQAGDRLMGLRSGDAGYTSSTSCPPIGSRVNSRAAR